MKQSWTFRIYLHPPHPTTPQSLPPKKNRDKDPNHIFNSFLCTSLNIFQAGFPVKYKCMKNKNEWITQEIIILQT